MLVDNKKMSYRFMRVIVMFDLPVLTSIQRKQYRDFRKELIKNGFLMMQESIYTKIALNQNSVNSVIHHIKKIKPLEGLVQILVITERQFARMEVLVGEVNTDIMNSDERILIL